MRATVLSVSALTASEHHNLQDQVSAAAQIQAKVNALGHGSIRALPVTPEGTPRMP